MNRSTPGLWGLDEIVCEKYEGYYVAILRLNAIFLLLYMSLIWQSRCSRSSRKWQPTPVFLPRESQGLWSLVGCRLWGQTLLKRLSSSSSNSRSSRVGQRLEFQALSSGMWCDSILAKWNAVHLAVLVMLGSYLTSLSLFLHEGSQRVRHDWATDLIWSDLMRGSQRRSAVYWEN